MTERFGSVDRLYATALSDLAAVLQQQPDQPLATFYRGFIGWRSRVKSDRNAGFEDLFRAVTLGNDDWETQLESARFRLGVARDPKQLDASQKSEYLQVALGNATRAIQLLQERTAKESTRLLQRWLLRALNMRCELYLELYTSSGKFDTYLELARDDVRAVIAIDPDEPRARRIETSVAIYEQEAKEAKADADAAAAKSVTPPSPAPTATLPEEPQESSFARNFIALFGPSEKGDKAKMLVDLLSRGGEIVSPLIAEVGDLSDGVMDQFINPYIKGATVSDAARTAAESEAETARRILQEAMRDGALSREVRVQARDHLTAAIAANPRNAQYHFELAAIEQSLGELEPARTHLASAVAIAPSNPIFRLQLALVCEQQQDLDQAAAHALAAAELAPGSVKLREIAVRLRDEAAKKKAAPPPPGNGG
jgi:tetratricopeptide (TPR) repeat protein